MTIMIKPGVFFLSESFRRPEVMRILWIAEMTAPPDYNITVTSGADGKHHPRSAHYTGKAVDLRTRDFPAGKSVATWASRMQSALGNQYFVLVEKDHIHAQVNV